MRPSKARYVTACQQLLALGAVLAVLTPAATLISLDVVHQQPDQGVSSRQPVAGFAAYTRSAQQASTVPTAPVDAELTEVPLTAARPSATGRKGGSLAATVTPRAKLDPLGGGREQVTSLPIPVEGYGGVGLTWDPATELDDHDATFDVRTSTDGRWSEWMAVEYHDEHGPDPDSAEGQQARPGTDLLMVGQVDELQVRSRVARGELPADLRVAVTAPGHESSTARQVAALDTGAGAADDVLVESSDDPAEGDEDVVALSAATYTPQPVVYSRRQWGANESLRDKGSLRYFEVHAGFVHHTVNANAYARNEVPGILRSIYAYHTQSRGWSDVGYNFLVDRFGRIWEGRAGGIDRPVVGAHTLGYNDYAFAMSAIGNFETAQPSAAMVEAYGALMAWKLSLHGVDASSTRQVVGPDTFRAINGHRDAGSTACPGRHLYARIGDIRDLAEQAQKGWAGRELESDLASSPHPDLLVRRSSDGQAVILPTGGLTGFRSGTTHPGAAAGTDLVVASPDLTGDGLGDLLVRDDGGTTRVLPATASGGFGAGIKPSGLFAGRDLVTPVGDVDGNGTNDVVARNAAGRLNVYLGGGGGAFERKRSGTASFAAYDLLAATGDLDGDGRPDLLAREGGVLWRLPGTGTKTFGAPVRVSGGWGKYDVITGYGDFNRDDRGDLLVRVAGAGGEVRTAREDGTFGPAVGPIARLRKGSALSAAQLNGDAAPDVVGRRGDDLVTWANNGTFDLGGAIETGLMVPNATALLNAGDWDRDGSGDIVVRTRAGRLLLHRGDGRGGFADGVRIGTGFDGVQLLAAVGDMTGDGWPDLMGQPAGSSMRLYPGRGADGLRASYVAHTRISAGRQVPVGRWTADGAPDSLFRNGGKLMLYPGNGPGGLTSPKTLGLDVSAYDWVVGVSDVNLTGHADVLARERASGHLYLFRATADGFKPRRYLGEGMGAYQLVG